MTQPEPPDPPGRGRGDEGGRHCAPREPGGQAGGVIFGAVFVATCTIGFHVVEGMEFANAFTYGGNYLSSFPFNIFGTFIRRFFTFVVPAAFVAYLPTLALLGRSDPAGLPTWLSWSAVPAAALAAAAAWWLWRLGLRHYVGAGS